ncbi:MAG: GNAT family N-acetyltransferase [Dokdonella sp.]|uniref:GNAT family N-acetyltransferase n=1 Tax=Dokdonella sp. TaxID=2291710 RepID=UPI0032668536
MIPDDFTIEPASWEQDLADLRAVRETVFLVEQSIPPEMEWDALDARSRHVIARDHDGRPIGTGRLTPDHGIGRMAVLANWRGKGVGEAIMRVLLEQARLLGYPAIELHAQTHALPFYEKLGFEPFGEEFLECAIPHRMMRRTVEPLAALASAPLPPAPEARLLIADDRSQALAAVTELLSVARYEIAIYTRDLDAALFDVAETLDQVKRIALSGRHAQVRILVQEPRKALADGHRLIGLAQRLTTPIAIRTPLEERDLQYPSAFLVNDRRGYFFRMLGSRLEGEGSTYAPGRHAQLLSLFDQVWERSSPSEDLRQLAF